MSHVSDNGFPFDGVLAQIPGAPPQPPPQAPYPPPQLTIPCSRLPALTEDRFKALFVRFASTTGLRLNDQDFVIDGQPISPWVLHRHIVARNGFDSVTANDEWPAVGLALGFPSFSAGDLTQPPRCAPTIAHQLQQLYNDFLRDFEQAYINHIHTLLRLQTLTQVSSTQPSQQQEQPYQPSDANHPAPHSGGESIHMTLPHQQQQQAQIIQFLRNQVAQGVLTREQAQERLVVLRTATAHAPNPPSPQIIHYLHNQGAQDLLTHERQAQERLVLLRTSTGDAPYPPSPQIIQFLRNQVAQGLLTREQAQERLTMLSRSHAPHPPSQQNVQCSRLPPLPEDRFKVLFAQFANITGLSLNAPDFVIDGRLVNPWVLHRAVFARNGFDSVTANDEWPAVGATLGFPPISAGDLTQPPRCAPPIAHRLQQLYNDSLRRFEQAYINNMLTRLRSSQALRQMSAEPPQQRAQPHQPTDTDFLLDFTRMHLGADEENMSGHRSGRDEGSEGTLPRTSEEDRGVWR